MKGPFSLHIDVGDVGKVRFPLVGSFILFCFMSTTQIIIEIIIVAFATIIWLKRLNGFIISLLHNGTMASSSSASRPWELARGRTLPMLANIQSHSTNT